MHAAVRKRFLKIGILKTMKKIFYIFSFGFLGLVVSTLIHAVVEIVALQIIFTNPKKYADTVWWQEWDLIHSFGAGLLWWSGLLIGLWLGFYFWRIVYVEGRHWRRSTQPPTNPPTSG
jgi:hypothetical protein